MAIVANPRKQIQMHCEVPDFIEGVRVAAECQLHARLDAPFEESVTDQ